jgi:hypothetical protein
MLQHKNNTNISEVIIYQTEDHQTKVQVRLEDETVWLTQKRMAKLFEVSIPTVNEHLKNIFFTKELEEKSVIRNFRITASDGKEYNTRHYNLDAIIAIGYRVNSKLATQFRIWATQRLKEYIIKGFVLDDERLKQEGGRSRYFQELLQRIRDIRSSERSFYQKITDVYATSVDYHKDDQLTKAFFATVQNKMHFAVHGLTAAEIINTRANSKKPFMGLTNFKGNYITTRDIVVAKNYLSEKELQQLNLIVSLYLDFAELQATNERPMKMADWIKKLDQFLHLSEKKLLTNAGKISAEEAHQKAELEFGKYRKERDDKYVSDFDREIKKLIRQSKEK